MHRLKQLQQPRTIRDTMVHTPNSLHLLLQEQIILVPVTIILDGLKLTCGISHQPSYQPSTPAPSAQSNTSGQQPPKMTAHTLKLLMLRRTSLKMGAFCRMIGIDGTL